MYFTRIQGGYLRQKLELLEGSSIYVLLGIVRIIVIVMSMRCATTAYAGIHASHKQGDVFKGLGKSAPQTLGNLIGIEGQTGIQIFSPGSFAIQCFRFRRCHTESISRRYLD